MSCNYAHACSILFAGGILVVAAWTPKALKARHACVLAWGYLSNVHGKGCMTCMYTPSWEVQNGRLVLPPMRLHRSLGRQGICLCNDWCFSWLRLCTGVLKTSDLSMHVLLVHPCGVQACGFHACACHAFSTMTCQLLWVHA